jgi:hypothetical protein
MPKRTLPDFSSPTTESLRELYRRSDDELVRCTVLEVIRLRGLMGEIDYYREAARGRTWATRRPVQVQAPHAGRTFARGVSSAVRPDRRV